MSSLTAEEIQTMRIALSLTDPALAVAHGVAPQFEWRVKPAGFEGLVRLVVEQQVSTAAAAAIWTRVREGLGTVDPDQILARSAEDLRGFGLSGQKAGYLRSISEAGLNGNLDFSRLREMDDEAAVSALTSIRGIGRWTAEVFLMFSEGRLDLFPAGDVALREAVRLADAADVRPSEKDLYVRAERWRPHRGIAAHMLWAYYSWKRTAKSRPITTTE
jgi:DNA-3-methyladenine glycosylase II